MSRPFEAVIFDFGGVITASPFEAFNRLEAERGLPQDFVRRVRHAFHMFHLVRLSSR